MTPSTNSDADWQDDARGDQGKPLPFTPKMGLIWDRLGLERDQLVGDGEQR